MKEIRKYLPPKNKRKENYSIDGSGRKNKKLSYLSDTKTLWEQDPKTLRIALTNSIGTAASTSTKLTAL